MLLGKSEWYMECTRYFYVKTSESGELQTLEQFVENFKTKNSKLMFYHETMRKYTYKYRNKDYKYDNLLNSKIVELELPAFYDVNSEFFGCITIESGYCLRLLQTLDRYLTKARFETIKASIILDIDFLNSDYSEVSYQWQYLQRCYFAENAIYSYYSAFEIILQLIWISKEYHKEKMDSIDEQNFENAVNSCNFKKLMSKLTKDNEFDLLRLFASQSDECKDYTLLNDFKCVRDWCNVFKHHGTLRFNGEREVGKPTVRFVPTQNSESSYLSGFSSNDFQYTYIDLDLEVLPELVKYHNAIISLAKRVIDSCHLIADFRTN